MKNTTRKIVLSSMLAALCCVATMLIKIPLPMQLGYVNIGDCIVLLCGWLLSPLYGFLAAGVGSALADLFAGFGVYAPATFVIKGLVALAAHFILRRLQHKTGNLFARIASGIPAELTMIVGYYLFEGFLMDFKAAWVNVPYNGAQGIVSLILALLLVQVFEKSKISLD